VEPADNLVLREEPGNVVGQCLIIVEPCVLYPLVIEESLDLLVRKRRTEKAAFLRVTAIRRAGVIQELVPREQGGAECSTRITCGRLDPARDRVELQLARWAIAEGKPLFGLCRGLQIVNVALGGTLYQDIAAQRRDAIKHDYFPTAGFPRDHLAHRVTVASGSRLDALVGSAPLEVNSMHHQAVKDLARGLVSTAVAPDGLVEGLEAPGSQFLLGVQWHPESLTDRDPRMHRLLTGFVEAASR